MTLGQEFRAFATTLGEDLDRLKRLVPELLTCEVNLGGTAIGTGINAAVGYAGCGGRQRWRRFRGGRLCRLADLIAATDDAGVFARHFGHFQAHRGEAVEDLQRPAPAVQRPADRDQRDQAAGRARPVQLDHARQGQPGDPRGGQPGGLRGGRQRPGGDHGRRGRPAAAQRYGALDRLQDVRTRCACCSAPWTCSASIAWWASPPTPSAAASWSSTASAWSPRSTPTSATRTPRASPSWPWTAAAACWSWCARKACWTRRCSPTSCAPST